MSDTENTNKLVLLFLNAVKVQGDTLSRLVGTLRKKQVQSVEIIAHSIRFDDLDRKKEGVVNLVIRYFWK